MGFRFSLQSANTVANLTFGRVMSCYRDIFQSWDSYRQFLSFLDSFENNFYSGTDQYYHNIKQITISKVKFIGKTILRYTTNFNPLHKPVAVKSTDTNYPLILQSVRFWISSRYDFFFFGSQTLPL